MGRCVSADICGRKNSSWTKKRNKQNRTDTPHYAVQKKFLIHLTLYPDFQCLRHEDIENRDTA
jgi:hypothetical protein